MNTVGIRFLPGFKNEEEKPAEEKPVVPPTFRDPGVDLAGFFEDKFSWSKATFGLDLPIRGILAHLKKELEEVEAEPNDLEEWVDVLFLALDGAARSGHSGKALIVKMVEKHQKNLRREWKVQSEGHFEHDRETVENKKKFYHYFLNVQGLLSLGPFDTWREAADLAVKWKLAKWDKDNPGALTWHYPQSNGIEEVIEP